MILSKLIKHFSSGGSEHTLNGHRFSAEIQLMHYNKKYGSLANALSHADGNETLHNIMSVTLNLIAIRFGCYRSFYG